MKWICSMREWKEGKGKGSWQEGDMASLCAGLFGGFHIFTSSCKAAIFWWWDAAVGVSVAVCLPEGHEVSSQLPQHSNAWASPLQNNEVQKQHHSWQQLREWQSCPVNVFMVVGLMSEKQLSQLQIISYETNEKIFSMIWWHHRTAVFYTVRNAFCVKRKDQILILLKNPFKKRLYLLRDEWASWHGCSFQGHML